jgi:carbon-monoxide dehydrogenase small subunit
MVMNAIDYAKHHPNPTEQQIREALEGNLCRCTGYVNIVESVRRAAVALDGSRP